MREMRRQDVPQIAARAAPDPPSQPAALVEFRNQKTSSHVHAHERHRLTVPPLPPLGEVPRQARARPHVARACPLPFAAIEAHSKNAPAIKTGLAAPCSWVLPGIADPSGLSR